MMSIGEQRSVILTRRQFVQLAGGSAAALGVGLLLAACGGAAAPAASSSAAPASAAPASSAVASAAASVSASPAPASGSAPASASGAVKVAGVTLPSYAAPNVPPPDLPGNTQGLVPAYFSFPKNLVKTVSQTPGSGGDVNVLHFTLYPPPAPTASNSAWQLLNKNLGVNFKMDILGAADYGAKLGSVIAGGSLPDIINIPPGATVPNFPQFLKADCQDLTAFLSGDAIKDYPNLAGYPTDAWKNVVYNGGIYGVPLPLDLTGDAVFVRQDWMSQAGVSMPTSGAEFKRVLQALTKPAQNHWGFAVVPSGGTNNGETGFGFFPQIFGAPNNWAVDSSGKFTKDIESDEYKQSLAYEADLWKAGVFEPSSTNYNQTQADGDFIGGKYAMHAILWVLYPFFTDRIGAGKVSYLPPFSANGGKPAYYLSRGYFSFVVLKKASSDRIKELLSILNYLGAPFGSQESLMTRYGVEGKDFAFDPQGNPQLTPQGQKDLPGNGAWSNLIQQPPVLYSNTHTKEYGQTMYNAEKQDLAVGIPDPTVGLFSNTQSNKGQLLAQLVGGKQTDIIFGRAPLSDWDQLLKDWRAQGGEQVRSEYQLAYAASKS